MPRFVGRAAGAALAATLLLPSTGVTLSSVPLAQRGADEPVRQIDRVVDIDRVTQLRLVDALNAEAAALTVASQGVLVPAEPVSWSAGGASGIPASVLAAYRAGEANLAASNPSCRLPWWVLAGIGRIESGHASGGRVDAAGTTRGRILGPRLDGSLAGTAVIADSDNGALDGDPGFDRAVGPMQFLPATWKGYARDGNGDGASDPNNVFDAATSAGAYLCRSGGDLSVPGNLVRAILAYNPSDSYVRSVLSWGAAYRDGASPVADAPGSVPLQVPRQPATPAPRPAPPAAVAPASAPARPSPRPSAPAPQSTQPPSQPAAVTASGSHGPQPGSTSATTGSSGAPVRTSTPAPSSPPSAAAGSQKPAKVPVPAVAGQTEEAARAALTAAGFVADVQAVASLTVAEGTVIKQNPLPGTPVDGGSTVHVTVSSGPQEAELPTVVGQTKEAATAALAAAGFGEPKVVRVDDPSQSKGAVVSTEPGGGQVVPVNTAVTVTVASGKVTVPNLVSLDTAAAALPVAGLRLRYQDTQGAESATVPDGKVVSQDLAPGTLVETGTVVTVTVTPSPPAAAATDQLKTAPPAVPSGESGKAKKKDGAGRHR